MMHKKLNIILIGCVIVFLLVGVLLVVKNKPSADSLVQTTENRMGVFGSASSELEETRGSWTRIPLSWQEWDTYKRTRQQSEKIKELESYKQNKGSSKVFVTIQTIHETKTKCKLPGKISYINYLYVLSDWIDIGWSDLSNFLSHQPSGTHAQGEVQCPPLNLNEYENFVKDIAQNYADVVDVWQIGNEVYRAPIAYKYWFGAFNETSNNNDFIETYESAYKALKSIIPRAVVAAPGIAFGRTDFNSDGSPVITDSKMNSPLTVNQSTVVRDDLQWLISQQNINTFIQKECNKFDIMDMHFYHTVSSIPNRIVGVKKLLADNHCVGKRLFASEIGGPLPAQDTKEYKYYLSQEGDNDFENAKSQELKGRFESILNNGVEIGLWFYYQDVKNTGVAGIDLLEKMGLVSVDGAKKPAFTTFQNLVDQFRVNKPPSVIMISPNQSTTIKYNKNVRYTLSADASDSDGIKEVSFYNGDDRVCVGVKGYQGNTNRYSCTVFRFNKGTYNLKAVAIDLSQSSLRSETPVVKILVKKK